MDPFTIAAGIAFFGTLAVAVVVITMEKIYKWFKSRSKIPVANNTVLGFTLATRLEGRAYATVPGVFTQKTHATEVIQGIFDERTGEILEARAVATNKSPDAEFIRLSEEAEGLIIYT